MKETLGSRILKVAEAWEMACAAKASCFGTSSYNQFATRADNLYRQLERLAEEVNMECPNCGQKRDFPTVSESVLEGSHGR